MTPPDARNLVGGLLERYGGLTTYQDEGSVAIRTKDESPIPRTTFETRFLRPCWFRFKFATPHPYPPLSDIVTTHVCGSDEEGAYLWTKHYEGQPKMKSYKSITMAVAGATGISSGAAHTIAQLLLEGFDKKELLSLRNAKVGDRQLVEDKACTPVHGELPRAKVGVTLFIDPDTMTLRQLETRFPDFTSIEVRRNIRMDAPFQRTAFERPYAET